jgi:hypothetical protein
MANDRTRMTMSNTSCEWVRKRLPLWVGDRGLRAGENSDGGDLNLAEHQSIERHLDSCAVCGRYRLELERASEVLSVAASVSPVDSQAPSLWPVLKGRIKDIDRPVPSRWSNVTLRAILGPGLAASIVIATITVSGVWRQWVNPQHRIKFNATPLADQDASPPPRASEPESDLNNSGRNETTDELVQTDVARPIEQPGTGATSATELKPTSPARFGYDLDHGIPMPPDARDSKPVY